MPITKNAYLRYQTLDKCFSNFRRRYYKEDLVKACCQTLFEQEGILDGVKARQIDYDISFMESENGWSIPLERIRDCKRIYYRYSDSSFSIKNHILSFEEADQLNELIKLFNRFKGLPNFAWLEELSLKLESDFNLEDNLQPFISFEQNQDLKGLEHLTILFNSIRNEKVLKIKYQSFTKLEEDTFVIHPYFLKQFNNRWFLYGLCNTIEDKMILNLPLDRIVEVLEINLDYIPNSDIDFNEYFDDVVGATVYVDKKAEKLLLEVTQTRFPYIKTKPLHPSQTELKNRISKSGGVLITIEVQITQELIALLLSFGSDIEVIEPILVRNLLRNEIKKMNDRY